jgi:hypothetical protein
MVVCLQMLVADSYADARWCAQLPTMAWQGWCSAATEGKRMTRKGKQLMLLLSLSVALTVVAATSRCLMQQQQQQQQHAHVGAINAQQVVVVMR